MISIATRGAPHQREWGNLFARGLNKHSIRPKMIDAGMRADTDVVACWGWKVAHEYLAQGKEVLVAERGYVGDRFEWTSLGWNGLNGRADFRNSDMPHERWETLWGNRLKPWREQGGYVLLLGQVGGDQAVRHIDYRKWVVDTARALMDIGHDVRWRSHPNDPSVTCPAKAIGGTLEHAFAGAMMAVGFSSNSTLDAVLAGVPTITMDEGAMAYAVTGHDVDRKPPAPDRTQWAANLAYCQWSWDEIENGTAWEHIGCTL